MFLLVNLNGKIIKEAKATISINNRSFRYGDGFFETIRITDGKIPLWNYHWERLWNSLQTLQFQPPSFFSAEFFKQQIIELAQKTGHQALGRVRLTVFRGNGGLYDPENHYPNFSIQTWQLNDVLQQFNSNGLVCGVYKKGIKSADFLANIKSNNYLLYAMAALHAKERHWNDALILNHKGTIVDTTIANIFLVKNGQIITPPLSDGPVAGTLRRYLLENGEKSGFSIAEQSFTPEDVNKADEVFLTNAIYGMKWIQRIGDISFNNQLSTSLYNRLIIPLWANEIKLNTD